MKLKDDVLSGTLLIQAVPKLLEGKVMCWKGLLAKKKGRTHGLSWDGRGGGKKVKRSNKRLPLIVLMPAAP